MRGSGVQTLSKKVGMGVGILSQPRLLKVTVGILWHGLQLRMLDIVA